MPFSVDIKYSVETEQEYGLLFPDSFDILMIQENGFKLLAEDLNR